MVMQAVRIAGVSRAAVAVTRQAVTVVETSSAGVAARVAAARVVVSRKVAVVMMVMMADSSALMTCLCSGAYPHAWCVRILCSCQMFCTGRV